VLDCTGAFGWILDYLTCTGKLDVDRVARAFRGSTSFFTLDQTWDNLQNNHNNNNTMKNAL